MTQDSQQTSSDMDFYNTPNVLTMIRMAFVPVVVGLLFLRTPQWDLIAAILFGVASITDFFDGYLARSRKIVTVYGKLMDPLADKFLVVSILVMLQHLDRVHPIVVIVLICRELAITGLRALASAEGVIIPASRFAKWKTIVQMFAIPFMMVKQGIWGIPTYSIGWVLLHLSVAVSLWSAVDYVIDFFRGLKETRRIKALKKQASSAPKEDREPQV